MNTKTKKAVDAVNDSAVSIISTAAGATVAPGTALSKLRGMVLRPAVLAALALVGVAYVLGRRAT